jgi:OFA family oxalate/formate antiporter-like MFS transporter
MRESTILQKRWGYALLGVVILLFAGIVYAWSVLSAPIGQEYPDWSKAQLSLTFTIVMTTFCIGCLAGGFLNRRLKPGVYCWISAALFLVGFLLAARTRGIALLYLGFGVCCGFASGFVYSAAMSTVGKWFPDKQGLISGVLLMGFGISSFIAGKIYQATLVNWRTSFTVIGVIGCAVLLLCGFFLKAPGESLNIPASPGKKRAVNPVARESTPAETLRNPSFWLYYLWAILLSAAGLTIVSQASGIVREVSSDLNPGTVATIVGLISIFNGIGRIFYGSAYDRVGRNATMQAVNGNFILAAAILIVAVSTRSIALIVLGFILGGFAYGGVTPTNSAFTSSYFGMKNYPVNFSFTNTNLIIASFGSTVAGALYDATRSFQSAFILMIVLAALGILVSQTMSLRDRAVLKKQKAQS